MRSVMKKLLALPLSIMLLQIPFVAESRASSRPANTSHRAPALGADFYYAGWPHPMIEAMQDQSKGKAMTKAFKSAGLSSLRFGFHGIYSPLGEEATARVKAENKTTNEYPWFPLEDYIDYAKAHEFTTVFGINVEEGPDVAFDSVKQFIREAGRRKLIAVELSNEPWLNHRPWLPEEYASRAADVIERLTPLGVKFGLPLTVGKEKNTPTKLSDDEWNSRMLRALSTRIDMKNRADIYGVIHLYSRGVSASTVRKFNDAVRPFSPRMRYLVTEFNIRLSLDGNPHLTNEYAMEFADKLAELMAEPNIEALYVHAVPYHSILYWSDGRRVVTVNGHRDSRITGEAKAQGWHLTPAGKVYHLYSTLAWKGDVVEYHGGDQSYWAVMHDGRLVVTLLNDSSKATKKKVKLAGREWNLSAPARSIVCFDENGRAIETLSLSY